MAARVSKAAGKLYTPEDVGSVDLGAATEMDGLAGDRALRRVGRLKTTGSFAENPLGFRKTTRIY